jgi:hypothetical protein
MSRSPKQSWDIFEVLNVAQVVLFVLAICFLWLEGWKFDVNKAVGLHPRTDVFEIGTLGPMSRDQVPSMDDAVPEMGKGKRESANEAVLAPVLVGLGRTLPV